MKRVPEPDPRSSSKWLINAWETLKDRDPVDAANDAEYLLALCNQRCADYVVEMTEEEE